MRSSAVPVLLWSYWGNIFYILGMFGYLTMDTITYLSPISNTNNTFITSIYLFLTIIFIIDAIFYSIDWYINAVKLREHENDPIEYRAEFISCIFLHIGSDLFFISTLLHFKKDQFMGTILLMNCLGIIAFLFEAGCTFIGWRITLRKKLPTNSKRGCTPQDVYMWAHLMNFFAGIIYLFATTIAYRIYLNSKIVNSSGVSILQMLGDFFYLFDAYLYYDCWKRDKQEYDELIEQQRLMELNLVRQLTTDNTQ